MARRHVGPVTVYLQYNDATDQHDCRVVLKDATGVKPPLSWKVQVGNSTGGRYAVDCPEAYDNAAHAAISFACHFDEMDYSEDDRAAEEYDRERASAFEQAVSSFMNDDGSYQMVRTTEQDLVAGRLRRVPNQPWWRCVLKTDDLAVFVDRTGKYGPEMEVAQDYQDEKSKVKYEIYRFSIDQQKEVRDEDDEPVAIYLVPERYREDWPHAVSQYEEWWVQDLARVAETVGTTRSELVKQLCSQDPVARSRAYFDIGSYHGFRNFDSDPGGWTERGFETRWAKYLESR